MIYQKFNAIDHLYSRFNTDDLSASSHWMEMHLTYKLERGKKLSGMRGFGGFCSRYNYIKYFGHLILRRKLIRVGKDFKLFQQIFKLAKEICRHQDRVIDQDMLRQVITLAYLYEKLESSYFDYKNSNILVIGDGWGSLTSILLGFTSSRIILINLNKTLLMDLLQIYRAFPDLNFCYVEDKDGLKAAMADESIRLISMAADNSNLLANIPINLAINIASMQEMNYQSIHGYFDALRKSPAEITYLYCCNRHSKRLPDGSLISFDNYGWLESDDDLDFSECPWHKEYYLFKPPFFRKFDGTHIHKLTRLTKSFE
jgi:hypothetical protein